MDWHQHLEEQLKEDFRLLKELEDQRRYEGEPRRRGKLDAEIKDIKEQIRAREAELKSFETKNSVRAITKAILRHSNKVSSVAISPDGKILASGSHDKTIKIWSLHSGELLRILSGHTSSVLFVAISPSGQTLASRSDGGTIRLWNTQSGEMLRTLIHLKRYRAFAISPNWQIFAFSDDDDTINLCNLDSGKLLRTLPIPPWARKYTVFSIVISPNGQFLAANHYPGSINLWNLHTKETRPTWSSQLGYFQESITVSPDGQILASLETSSKGITLWYLHSGMEFQVIKPSSQTTSPITISNDSQILAVGCFDGTISLWELNTGKLLRTFEGHSAPVTSIAVSPDGQTLVSGSDDGTIRIWNL